MFALPPTDVSPSTRQALVTKKTMIMIFFARCELITLNILPKGSKFNKLYFVDYIFPDLERENANFYCGISQATFGNIETIQCAVMDQNDRFGVLCVKFQTW
jgi:hypothetical protein